MLKFFADNPDIIAAMSEKADGSMNLVAVDQTVADHRRAFFDSVDPRRKVISANLVHGSSVVVVDSSSVDIIVGTDGLTTTDPNILLSITIADCVPIFFYDSNKKIIGLAHSGWRGTVANIVGEAVRAIESLGGSSSNLLVALGPGINVCHFEIQSDVLDRFSAYSECIEHRAGKIFVDLKKIITKQLVDCGVQVSNIENHPDCTMEGDRYFSYRRDKPAIVETMVAVIGLK
jgi:YfiH family protein